MIFAHLISVALADTANITVSNSIPGNNASSTGITGFVGNFYQFALLISGVLAFGAIVYGGVKYAFAHGDPHGEGEARSWITGAIIGLILLACAYIILNTVNPAILNMSIPALPTVQNVNPNTNNTQNILNNTQNGVNSQNNNGG